MVPLLMSLVAGSKGITSIKTSILFSLLFILGLSVTLTALGLISALMGSLFGDVGGFWKYLVVGVCLLMGIHLLGLLKLNFHVPRLSGKTKGGFFGVFLFGLLFGVVSTPCAVPILAVLLAYTASQGNVVYGGFLLFVYALGHSVLVLIAGSSMGAAKRLLESKGLRKANLALSRIAGGVMILLAAYFFYRLW